MSGGHVVSVLRVTGARHLGLGVRRDGQVFGATDIGSRSALPVRAKADLLAVRGDRLGAEPASGLGAQGLGQAVVEAGVIRAVVHRVGVALPAGQALQRWLGHSVCHFQQGGAVAGQEGAEVDQPGDPPRVQLRRAGDREAARGMADQDRRLLGMVEHAARIIVQGQAVMGAGIAAATGQVGGGHVMSPSQKLGDRQVPAPAGMAGAVDQHETGHQMWAIRCRGRPSRPRLAGGCRRCTCPRRSSSRSTCRRAGAVRSGPAAGRRCCPRLRSRCASEGRC